MTLLILGACSHVRDGAPLPELPRIAVQNSFPAIRDRIQQAYDAARARPDDAAVNGRLGMVLQAHEMIDAAAVCYERAHRLDPGSFQWAYYLGVVQGALGRYTDAVVTLRAALRPKPDYLPGRLKLADALLASGASEAGGAIYESILAEHPGCAAAHRGLGMVRFAREDWAGAAASLRKACDLYPEYGASHYTLSRVERNLGNADAANLELALFAKNRLGAPPDEDPLMDAVAAFYSGGVRHARTGTLMAAAGRLEQAARVHEMALEIDPTIVGSHVNLISVYTRLGKFDKAEAHYRAALALNSSTADAHLYYAILLATRARYAEALPILDEALQVNPYSAEVHYSRGGVLRNLGQKDAALESYLAAVKNKPDYREARYQAARILIEKRRFTDAVAQLSRTLDPEDDRTPDYLSALASAYAGAGDSVKARAVTLRAKALAPSRGGPLVPGGAGESLDRSGSATGPR